MKDTLARDHVAEVDDRLVMVQAHLTDVHDRLIKQGDLLAAHHRALGDADVHLERYRRRIASLEDRVRILEGATEDPFAGLTDPPDPNELLAAQLD